MPQVRPSLPFLLLLAAAGAGLAAPAPAAAPPARYFALHTVGAGAYAALTVPGSPAGSNAGFVVGQRAVLVVDSFENADAARALLAAIGRTTPLPVKYLVNTHYHLDHVTGNQVFADAGAVILAQDNVPGWIHTENLKFFNGHPTPAQRAWVAGLRAPDLTYAAGVNLDPGGRTLEVRAYPGHTGGDSVVIVPGATAAATVVYTGDLYWGHALPNTIDAHTDQQAASLAELLRLYPQATFVGGHGVIGHAAEVADFRDYLLALRAAVRQALDQGLSGDALSRQVVSALQPRYGDWGFFAHFAPLNAIQTAAELNGTKQYPPAAADPAGATAAVLQRIGSDPNRLAAFFGAMPKGGDLHNHLSGAVWAETWLLDAAAAHLCADAGGQLSSPPCGEGRAAVDPADEDQRRRLIAAWSMRDFVPRAGESGHDHFFDTFGKFDLADRGHDAGDLAQALNQAAADRVSYVEFMVTPDEAGPAAMAAALPWPSGAPDLAALERALGTPRLTAAVAGARAELDAAMAGARRQLQCGTAAAAPGCAVEARFLYQALRGLDPAVVFAQFMTGYALAQSDPLVVGMNLVMPEDGYVALRDFELQMHMLDLLHRQHPDVKVALHAGELAPGMVPDADLTFHIRDSIEIGHALRIGHGVDVMHETRPFELLREMAARHVLVEICLTSNDEILGIRGAAHPLPMYLQFHVPVALATDDEGVSRGDLTREFIRAEASYHLPYATLKQMVRASLDHAFVAGDSLWRGPDDDQPAAACAAAPLGVGAPGAACAALLAASPKARLEWQLEGQLNGFETWVAAQTAW